MSDTGHQGSENLVPRRPVPWSYVLKLIRDFYKLRRNLKGQQLHTRSVAEIFEEWVRHLPGDDSGPAGPQYCEPGTGAALFALLFPHLDTRRRYHYSAAALAKSLLDMNSTGYNARDLEAWANDRLGQVESRAHCLGLAAYDARREHLKASESSTQPSQRSALTLHSVHRLLDSIASSSRFSGRDAHGPRQLGGFSKSEALCELFKGQTPMSWAFLCQVLLRDIGPLFCASDRKSGDAAIKDHTASSVRKLELEDALRIWHPGLPNVSKVRADLHLALKEADGKSSETKIEATLQLGVRVAVATHTKSHQPQCIDSLQELRVWAEYKYDGERAQIHVDLTQAAPVIRIFSKSGRDSTTDRRKCHSIILAALGRIPKGRLTPDDELLLSRLEVKTSPLPLETPVKGIVLEAEMVPFDETTGRDSEFYKLRYINENIIHSRKPVADLSLTERSKLHHKLVFFDVLYFDGVDCMPLPYKERRGLLEKSIRTIPGFSMLAERHLINFDADLPDLEGLGDDDYSTRFRAQQRTYAYSKLREAWAVIYANKIEGCMLKAESHPHPAHHTSLTHRWIKVKADYIDNFGDTLDLCIIGAGWNARRGEELGHINSRVLNTVHYGYVTKDENGRWQVIALDACSYGRPANDLRALTTLVENTFVEKYKWTPEDAHELRKKKEKVVKFRAYDLIIRNTDPIEATPPIWLFGQPLVGTFLGAGFTKHSGCPLYVLRWPRLQNWYHPFRNEGRCWKGTVDCDEVQNIATHAMQPSDDLEFMERDYLRILRHISEEKDRADLVVPPHVRKRFEEILDEARRIRSPGLLDCPVADIVSVALHPQHKSPSAPLDRLSWSSLIELSRLTNGYVEDPRWSVADLASDLSRPNTPTGSAADSNCTNMRSSSSSGRRSISTPVRAIRLNTGTELITNAALRQAAKRRTQEEKKRLKREAGPSLFHGKSMNLSRDLQALHASGRTLSDPLAERADGELRGTLMTATANLVHSGDHPSLRTLHGPPSFSLLSSRPPRIPGDAGMDDQLQIDISSNVANASCQSPNHDNVGGKLRVLPSSRADIRTEAITENGDGGTSRNDCLVETRRSVPRNASAAQSPQSPPHQLSPAPQNCHPMSTHVRRLLLPSHSAPLLLAQRASEGGLCTKRLAEQDDAARKQRRVLTEGLLVSNRHGKKAYSPRKGLLASMSAPIISTVRPTSSSTAASYRHLLTPPRLTDAYVHVSARSTGPTHGELRSKKYVFSRAALFYLVTQPLPASQRASCGLIFADRQSAEADEELWAQVEIMPQVLTSPSSNDGTYLQQSSVLRETVQVFELEAAALMAALLVSCRNTCRTNKHQTIAAVDELPEVTSSDFCPHILSLQQYRIHGPIVPQARSSSHRLI